MKKKDNEIEMLKSKYTKNLLRAEKKQKKREIWVTKYKVPKKWRKLDNPKKTRQKTLMGKIFKKTVAKEFI